MRSDKQLLVLTHLSQLLDFVTGVGGFLVSLFLWLSNRDQIDGMDIQGKAILNFKISIFIYSLACLPLLFLLGLGLLGIIIIGFISLVFTIINALKVNKGELPRSPFSFRILK